MESRLNILDIPEIAKSILAYLDRWYIGIYRRLCRAYNEYIKRGQLSILPLLTRWEKINYIYSLYSANNRAELAAIFGPKSADNILATSPASPKTASLLPRCIDKYSDMNLLQFIYKNAYYSFTYKNKAVIEQILADDQQIIMRDSLQYKYSHPDNFEGQDISTTFYWTYYFDRIDIFKKKCFDMDITVPHGAIGSIIGRDDVSWLDDLYNSGLLNGEFCANYVGNFPKCLKWLHEHNFDIMPIIHDAGHHFQGGHTEMLNYLYDNGIKFNLSADDLPNVKVDTLNWLCEHGFKQLCDPKNIPYRITVEAKVDSCIWWQSRGYDLGVFNGIHGRLRPEVRIWLIEQGISKYKSWMDYPSLDSKHNLPSVIWYEQAVIKMSHDFSNKWIRFLIKSSLKLRHPHNLARILGFFGASRISAIVDEKIMDKITFAIMSDHVNLIKTWYIKGPKIDWLWALNNVAMINSPETIIWLLLNAKNADLAKKCRKLLKLYFRYLCYRGKTFPILGNKYKKMLEDYKDILPANIINPLRKVPYSYI